MMTLSFERPALVSDLPLSDYISDNKSGFIAQPNSRDISNKINMFFEKNLFQKIWIYKK